MRMAIRAAPARPNYFISSGDENSNEYETADIVEMKSDGTYETTTLPEDTQKARLHEQRKQHIENDELAAAILQTWNGITLPVLCIIVLCLYAFNSHVSLPCTKTPLTNTSCLADSKAWRVYNWTAETYSVTPNNEAALPGVDQTMKSVQLYPIAVQDDPDTEDLAAGSGFRSATTGGV